MSTKTNRAIAAAAAVLIALPAFSLTPAAAAPLTEVNYRHGDGAAAFGAFAMFAGTIAAIAAAQHERDRYYEGGAYGYEPAPYAYRPYAYEPRYGGERGGWRGHWHRQ